MARQWASGFDGSAGTLVVTTGDAALWTDSRYFLQAAEQLSGTGIRLMKDGLEDTPSIAEWLCRNLTPGSVVGMDGWVNTMSDVTSLQKELAASGLQLELGLDAVSELWLSRPSIPLNEVELQPVEYAGEECASKISRLREAMAQLGAEATVVSLLDEVAWLTNLRGSDVHCNPVFVSYLLVTNSATTLFINAQKLTPQVSSYLSAQGIAVEPYDSLSRHLAHGFASIVLDPATTNSCIFKALPEGCHVVEHPSLVAPMKAVKNDAEIQGFRNAMRRDGVAMVRFLMALTPSLTELSVDELLTSFRAQQPLFRGLSFDTIAAYGSHGAIVHYEATPATDIPLQPQGLLLLDSGAQYQDGTTDITRTIPLGPLTQSERLDYTLVLKGHIRLALTKFPKGACGTQIDALARYAMWQHGINFLHGTGHGVGSYLNVHEGPHQIRMNYKPAPLLPGMTVTNEPGIYRAGEHGVRIENTMLVVPYMKTEFGEFLQLEALTLCPIATAPILMEMMQQDEIDYLNSYHQRVYDELSPLLDAEEKAWLREATKPLHSA